MNAQPRDGAALVVNVAPDATDDDIEALAEQFIAGLLRRAEDVSPTQTS